MEKNIMNSDSEIRSEVPENVPEETNPRSSSDALIIEITNDLLEKIQSPKRDYKDESESERVLVVVKADVEKEGDAEEEGDIEEEGDDGDNDDVEMEGDVEEERGVERQSDNKAEGGDRDDVDVEEEGDVEDEEDIEEEGDDGDNGDVEMEGDVEEESSVERQSDNEEEGGDRDDVDVEEEGDVEDEGNIEEEGGDGDVREESDVEEKSDFEEDLELEDSDVYSATLSGSDGNSSSSAAPSSESESESEVETTTKKFTPKAHLTYIICNENNCEKVVERRRYMRHLMEANNHRLTRDEATKIAKSITRVGRASFEKVERKTVRCEFCNKRVHQILRHIKRCHPEIVSDAHRRNRKKGMLLENGLLLSQFESWLRSNSGGKKTGKGVSNQTERMRTILCKAKCNFLKMSGEQVDQLLCQLETGRKANTIIAYCNSLIKFHKFAQSKELGGWISTAGAKHDMSGWKQAQTKKVAEEAHNRRQLRSVKLKNVESVVDCWNYWKKEFADKYTNRGDDFRITELEHLKNGVIFMLVSQNALRPSQIYNMKRSELQNAHFNPRNDLYAVDIFTHKTSSEYGEARVVIQKDVFAALKLVDKWQNSMHLDGEHVFRTRNLRTMTSSEVNKRLSRAYLSYSPNSHVVFTSGDLRIAYTTLSCKFLQQDQQDKINRHMMHSTGVADQYYNMSRYQDQFAFEAFRLMQDIPKLSSQITEEEMVLVSEDEGREEEEEEEETEPQKDVPATRKKVVKTTKQTSPKKIVEKRKSSVLKTKRKSLVDYDLSSDEELIPAKFFSPEQITQDEGPSLRERCSPRLSKSSKSYEDIQSEEESSGSEPKSAVSYEYPLPSRLEQSKKDAQQSTSSWVRKHATPQKKKTTSTPSESSNLVLFSDDERSQAGSAMITPPNRKTSSLLREIDSPSKNRRSTPKIGARSKWTEDEVTVLLHVFRQTISDGIVPKQKYVEDVCDSNHILQCRTPKNVVDKLRHVLKNPNFYNKKF